MMHRPMKKIKPNRKVIDGCTHYAEPNLIQWIEFPRYHFGHYINKGEYVIKDWACDCRIDNNIYYQCYESNVLIRNSKRTKLNVDQWEENRRNVQKAFNSMDGNLGWIGVIILSFIFPETKGYYNLKYWINITINSGLNFHISGGMMSDSDQFGCSIKQCSFFNRIQSRQDVLITVSGLGTACIFPEPNPVLKRLTSDRNFDDDGNNLLCVIIRMGLKDIICNSEYGWEDSHQLIILMTYEHSMNGRRLKTDYYYDDRNITVFKHGRSMNFIIWAFCPTQKKYYNPLNNCGCAKYK